MQYGKVFIKEGKENMDIGVIHQFLSEHSYWARGISYSFVDNSLTNSFSIGAFAGRATSRIWKSDHGFLYVRLVSRFLRAGRISWTGNFKDDVVIPV